METFSSPGSVWASWQLSPWTGLDSNLQPFAVCPLLSFCYPFPAQKIILKPQIVNMKKYVTHTDAFKALKVQVVGFRDIYWQKWSIIFIPMFLVVLNPLKRSIIVFSLAQNWRLYPHKVIFHRVCHVVLQLSWGNKSNTGPQYCLPLPHFHIVLHGWSWEKFCNLTARPLSTKSYTHTGPLCIQQQARKSF